MLTRAHRTWLINSTVSDNAAPHGSGSGIDNDGGTLTLTNSIVANGARGGDCFNNFGGTTVSHGYNLDGDGTCNLTATGDLPGTNPMLDPLALNPPGTTETQALQLGSPAIDHIPPGVNGCGTTVSTDQRGVSRPQGSGCDIGAYERVVPPTPTPSPLPVGGIVDLPVSGSGSGSAALPVALVGGAALAMTMGVLYGRRRWSR